MAVYKYNCPSHFAKKKKKKLSILNIQNLRVSVLMFSKTPCPLHVWSLGLEKDPERIYVSWARKTNKKRDDVCEVVCGGVIRKHCDIFES
jgi:hypothetical protein